VKVMFKSRKGDYIAKVGIFLVLIALIVVMIGCDGGDKYNLTMAVAPSGSGTATDLTNASPYAAGTAVSIKAVAAAGYRFVSWAAPAGTFGSVTAAQTTFTMPAQNVTVTANFAPFAGGTGTSGDPYQIADWHQLDKIRDYLDSSFILINNLDSATAGYTELASPTANGGKGWQPIGGLSPDVEEPIDPFTGTFDGQGYEIKDLYIDRPDEDGVGLFGAVDAGGLIENVEAMDGYVTGGMGVGILIGGSGGGVSNSSSSGGVSGSIAVGGLVGGNAGSISYCHCVATVTGSGSVGGLVGANGPGSDVSNSYADSDVTGSSGNLGGLVGFNWAGGVARCYALGNVSGDVGSTYVGGLTGDNFGGNVSGCYALGNVNGGEGSMYIGGLVADNAGGTIENSYALGFVIGGEGSQYVGGLAGLNADFFDDLATVSDCYSAGSVTGNYSTGGLVGENDGTVSNSFWDTETSGQATSAGGAGKTTAEMQHISTFTGASWDIVAVASADDRDTGYVWNIVDDTTYPFLSWQPV
jgi:hypothetical protein